jgi:hypothetical protein
MVTFTPSLRDTVEDLATYGTSRYASISQPTEGIREKLEAVLLRECDYLNFSLAHHL